MWDNVEGSRCSASLRQPPTIQYSERWRLSEHSQMKELANKRRQSQLGTRRTRDKGSFFTSTDGAVRRGGRIELFNTHLRRTCRITKSLLDTFVSFIAFSHWSPPACRDFKKPHLSFVLKTNSADWLEGERSVTRQRLPAEKAVRCKILKYGSSCRDDALPALFFLFFFGGGEAAGDSIC